MTTNPTPTQATICPPDHLRYYSKKGQDILAQQIELEESDAAQKRFVTTKNGRTIGVTQSIFVPDSETMTTTYEVDGRVSRTYGEKYQLAVSPEQITGPARGIVLETWAETTGSGQIVSPTRHPGMFVHAAMAIAATIGFLGLALISHETTLSRSFRR